MRLPVIFLALVVTFAPFAFAQENAGRVLAAVGDVVIERGAERIPARANTEVLAGDTLHLGAQSNAQIRFTDDSVVALGPETSFRVTEYAFKGLPPESQRLFFSLIKGGMRTVSGLIGRGRPGNYGVGTTQATLGIRGTAYAACQDCTSVGGQLLPGTTVGFTEGTGSITTRAGELLLATGESAYASDLNAPPVRIPSFPQTLQQASARPKATQQTAAKESASAVAASNAPAVAQPTNGVVIAAGATAAPVFQATSTPNAAAVVGSSFSGTTFYRLSGPFNIPTSCTSGTCANAVAGSFTLGVNFALQRATAGAAFQTSSGEIFNIGIPGNLSGVPVSISGNQATFSGTFNRADSSFNSGAFKCSACGPNSTPGLVDQLTVSGTINGSEATLKFAVPDGAITVLLTQQAPPNNSVAAIAAPALTGGDARSAAYWDVLLDSSGQLLEFGPEVGGPKASVGGATNRIVGTATGAGNLVWGTWTNGTTPQTKATFTDRDYATFQPNNGSVQPWITGDASNSLPPSLGALTFNPVGSILSNPNATLNSAKLTADFVNHSLILSINASAAPGTAGTNIFQMNATTGFSPTTNRFSSGFNSVACSGPCNNGAGTASGSFGGFFSGPQAQGAGLAFTTGFGGATATPGSANGVSGAIAFGR